jgi:enoyl-CoA hydratase/carnithine racemase
MSEERVKIEDDGAIRVVTLSRPAKKNAIDIEMASGLWRAIESAQADANVRALVVTGEGDYFTGGADVNLFLNMTNVDPTEVAKVAHLYEPLRKCDKPTIAMVQGHAVGMGVTVLPHFDMVYAADHATFMTPFVRLGLVIEYGASHTLSRAIGVQRTKELILRATPIDAKTAYEWGLVTRIFPASELRARTMSLAKDLAENPPSAIADCKRLIDQGATASFTDTTAAEESVLARRYGSEENVRAVMAMMERKRRV